MMKTEEITEKIRLIDAQIEELENSRNILENYRCQLKNPDHKFFDWSVEGENILKQ